MARPMLKPHETDVVNSAVRARIARVNSTPANAHVRGQRVGAEARRPTWLTSSVFLAVGSVIALQQAASSASGRWRRSAAVAVLASAAVGSNAVRAAQHYRRRRSAHFRAEASFALAAAFKAIVDATRLESHEIGLNAFLVRKPLLPFLPSTLTRVAEVRLLDTPGSTRIRWTRGKGAIGVCWDRGEIVVCHTERLYSGIQSAIEWRDLDAATQMNLTYVEMDAIRARYSGVIAVPIWMEHGQVEGVIALDTVAGVDFGLLEKEPDEMSVIIDLLIEACGAIVSTIAHHPMRTQIF